jgi:hypothetical protein
MKVTHNMEGCVHHLSMQIMNYEGNVHVTFEVLTALKMSTVICQVLKPFVQDYAASQPNIPQSTNCSYLIFTALRNCCICFHFFASIFCTENNYIYSDIYELRASRWYGLLWAVSCVCLHNLSGRTVQEMTFQKLFRSQPPPPPKLYRNV